MLRRGNSELIKQGARITKELITHFPKSGGEVAGLWAEQGSGKTAFLVTVAGRTAYFNEKNRRLMKETVIWRGRPKDNWHLVEGKKFCVHIHFLDEIEFLDKNGTPITDLQIFKYDTAEDIIKNLKRGWVNVYYEPQNYLMDEELVEEIRKKQFIDTFPEVADPIFFTYELVYYIERYKRHDEFITFIIDEADELFEANPEGIKHHLQSWFRKTCLRDLRKSKLSFILASHDYREIDYRIMFKLMNKIYFPSAAIPPARYKSAIRKKDFAMRLKMGQYLIEKKGNFGIAEYDEINTDHSVRAVWIKQK